MANEKYLIPGSERTKEELRVNGRKGGLKSGEARRKRKAVKTAILDILYADSPNRSGELILDDLALSCVQRILEKGDPAELEKLLAIAGMTPEEKRKEKESKRRDEELELKKQAVNGNMNAGDVEDLTPLADMLND